MDVYLLLFFFSPGNWPSLRIREIGGIQKSAIAAWNIPHKG